jgi:hypothetical protein
MLQVNETTESTVEIPTLDNPVMCLELGETLIFSIADDDHYPRYEKDSLLNSNMNFDYGPFLELENMMDSGNTTIKSFAYTFRSSGRYAFTDSDDSDNLLLVTVMSEGEECSEPYVREKSDVTLPLFGFK